MGRQFVKVFFSVLLALLLLFAGTVYAVDPYYEYHGPWGGLPLRLNNGRYQNAGVARNLDYDTLIVGTSVSANFLTSQLDNLLGTRSKKLIVLDGYFSDFAPPLDIAFKTHEVKRVFWGIDSNILGRSETEKTVDLPGYLYNSNPFDNVKYLLNKEIFFSDVADVVNMGIKKQTGDGASGGFLWGGDLSWSKKLALVSYQRPEQVADMADKDALLPEAEKNLAVVESYLKVHPDTQFTFYLAPYSILFWDMTIRTGKLDATLEMQREVMEKLTAYPNAEVFYFMDRYDLITDLDRYGDHIHYSPEVSGELVQELACGTPIAKEDIEGRLKALRSFVCSYDYDAIWEESAGAER